MELLHPGCVRNRVQRFRHQCYQRGPCDDMSLPPDQLAALADKAYKAHVDAEKMWLELGVRAELEAVHPIVQQRMQDFRLASQAAHDQAAAAEKELREIRDELTAALRDRASLAAVNPGDRKISRADRWESSAMRVAADADIEALEQQAQTFET